LAAQARAFVRTEQNVKANIISAGKSS
jgi:hypothetical protein